MSIGKRIYELRQQLNITQKELATAANITEATLSRYENDLRKPRGEITATMARIFGVSADYLLLGDENDYKIPTLKPKDETDLEKIIENLKKTLLEENELTLSGNVVTSEALESLIVALDVGLAQAKIINKKYITKK